MENILRTAKYCSAINCSNNSKTSIDHRTQQRVRFHAFPNPEKERERCLQWIANVGRTDMTLTQLKYRTVCSIHFERNAYNCPKDIAISYLLPTAVPTLFGCSKCSPSEQASEATPSEPTLKKMCLSSMNGEHDESTSRPKSSFHGTVADTGTSKPNLYFVTKQHSFDGALDTESETCKQASEATPSEPPPKKMCLPSVNDESTKQSSFHGAAAETGTSDADLYFVSKQPSFDGAASDSETSEHEVYLVDSDPESSESEHDEPVPVYVVASQSPANVVPSFSKAPGSDVTSQFSHTEANIEIVRLQQKLAAAKSSIRMYQKDIQLLKGKNRRLEIAKNKHKEGQELLLFKLDKERKAYVEKLLGMLPPIPAALVNIILKYAKCGKWTDDPGVMNTCLSLFVRSSSAYETLRSVGFTLPHQNTLKKHFPDIFSDEMDI